MSMSVDVAKSPPSPQEKRATNHVPHDGRKSGRGAPSVHVVDDEARETSEDEQRYSDYSDSTADRELYLTEPQREKFHLRLLSEGIDFPEDSFGKPIFTKGYVRALPQDLAREILAADAEGGERRTGSYSEGSWSGSDAEMPDSTRRMTEEQRKSEYRAASSIAPPPPEVLLEIKYTPSGLGHIADQDGAPVPFSEIIKYLEDTAFTEADLQKLEGLHHDKDANLLAQIRMQRRDEEKNTSLKSPESVMKLHEMALRYVPEVNIRPKNTDPMTLFRHGSENAHKGAPRPLKAQQKGPEFIHLLDPRDFGMGRVDSYATVPSTIERKFSNATVRGSLISTHMSDMPSMFSQALVEEPSTDVLTASQQQFDITPASAAKFRENWLTNFVKGQTARNNFTISIINLITRKNVEMRVCKEYTINQICHMYMQYDDHPEYYVWRDIFGRVLNPLRTLVENGMMAPDEKMEFMGYRKMPVILLYFRDGFENDPPTPLNPVHAMRQKEPGACRNY